MHSGNIQLCESAAIHLRSRPELYKFSNPYVPDCEGYGCVLGRIGQLAGWQVRSPIALVAFALYHDQPLQDWASDFSGRNRYVSEALAAARNAEAHALEHTFYDQLTRSGASHFRSDAGQASWALRWFVREVLGGPDLIGKERCPSPLVRDDLIGFHYTPSNYEDFVRLNDFNAVRVNAAELEARVASFERARREMQVTWERDYVTGDLFQVNEATGERRLIEVGGRRRRPEEVSS